MVDRGERDEGEAGPFVPSWSADAEVSAVPPRPDLASQPWDGEGWDPAEGGGTEGLAPEAAADIQAALDDWEAPAHLRDRPLPSRLSAWRRSSLLGAMAAGIPLGLREVLDPPKDEPIVIEVDADGEPHDLPIRLLLDPDDPSGSLCIVRRDPSPPVV